MANSKNTLELVRSKPDGATARRGAFWQQGDIFHAAGVLVDRSRRPNAIYVADTGNNRILGLRGSDSREDDIVFGQPNLQSSAPNGDCNIGGFGPPTRTSLCPMDIPGNTNLSEQWLRLNFDVDSEGNLYVPDHGNNRVLMFSRAVQHGHIQQQRRCGKWS